MAPWQKSAGKNGAGQKNADKIAPLKMHKDKIAQIQKSTGQNSAGKMV